MPGRGDPYGRYTNLPQRSRWPSRRWWIGIGLLLALLGVRAVLPVLVLRYVNNTLSNIPEYYAHIGDVELHLWRGAYEIDDVRLIRTTGAVPVPLFKAPRVDLSIEWGALLHDGAIVGKIVVDSPELTFVSAPSPKARQASVDPSWIVRVQDLYPLRLNRVEVRQGTVRFQSFQSDPRVEIEMTDVAGVAADLTQRPSPYEALPAQLHARGRAPGGGTLVVDGRLDTLAAQPTFSIDVSLEKVALRSLNDLLKAYGNVDAEAGSFSAHSELAAEHGHFEGYVKPLFFQPAASALQNPDDERAATKIPLRGRFDQPSPDLWAAIGGLLRHAFVQAILPAIEGSVAPPAAPRENKG